MNFYEAEARNATPLLELLMTTCKWPLHQPPQGYNNSLFSTGTYTYEVKFHGLY